ncbi:peptide ABC transporter permease [Methyloligella solikamskensis]|uniref:Peptide ABC transporter permease n=1 Tax=Methyloligella solikamskensis TaxID=1177756 RepID=A0ABW3JBN7_9HYPH
MINRNPRHPKDGRTIAGRKARQGEIVLKTTPMRLVFIAGFIGIAVLAVFFQWYL